MSKEVKNVPQIRFPGFTGDWEQRKLSDIYKDIGNAFVGTATPYYVEEGHFYLESNNIKDGQINHNTEVFINDEFYEKQKDKWLHTGDMVMVQSGHVGHAAVIPEELDCSAAHALIMFRNPKIEIEPYFLNYQYQTTKAKKKIENITTGNTIKHILASEMQEFVVDVTSCDEQGKIAGFFRDLDNLITLHQRKYDSIVKLKKCMLQKMFPKNGEKNPEIRFPGFTDDWEQRKLGDLINETRDKTTVEDEDTLLSCAIDGMFLNSELFSHFRGSSNIGYLKVKKNDLILSAQNLHLGNCNVNLRFEHGIISPAYKVYELIECDPLFIQAWVKQDKTKDFFLKASTEGASVCRKNIVWEELYKQELPVPKIDEQIKIGAFFENIDNLITLHQRKLDAYKKLKKAMLQKMFI